MFTHTLRRTILCAAVALTLLAPAAQADDWAADWSTDAQTAVDPAIRTALLQERTSSIAAGRSLDAVEAARLTRFDTPVAGPAPVDRFHWDEFGIGVASALGSVLVLAGLVAAVLATRRRGQVTGLAAS